MSYLVICIYIYIYIYIYIERERERDNSDTEYNLFHETKSKYKILIWILPKLMHQYHYGPLLQQEPNRLMSCLVYIYIYI